jgi:hypothetical protein
MDNVFEHGAFFWMRLGCTARYVVVDEQTRLPKKEDA